MKGKFLSLLPFILIFSVCPLFSSAVLAIEKATEGIIDESSSDRKTGRYTSPFSIKLTHHPLFAEHKGTVPVC